MYTELNGNQVKSGDLIRYPVSSTSFALAVVRRVTGDNERREDFPMSFNASLEIAQFSGVTVDEANKKTTFKKLTLGLKQVFIVPPDEIENSNAYSEPGKALIREAIHDVKAGALD